MIPNILILKTCLAELGRTKIAADTPAEEAIKGCAAYEALQEYIETVAKRLGKK